MALSWWTGNSTREDTVRRDQYHVVGNDGAYSSLFYSIPLMLVLGNEQGSLKSTLLYDNLRNNGPGLPKSNVGP